MQYLRHLAASTLARSIPRGILTDREFFRLWERHGYHILATTPSSPVPVLGTFDGHTGLQRKKSLGLDFRDREQRQLMQALAMIAEKEADELTRFIKLHQLPAGGYAMADMMTLHCLLRRLRPRQVIEVGAGVSTIISGYALILNAKETEYEAQLNCIDPCPDPVLDGGVLGLTTLLRTPVHDVQPEYFESLSCGDVLFIDSSHVCKVGSDVNYLILEILPRLNPGVWVHFHDIFLPDEYPRSWVTAAHRFWNEQYLLHAFLAFNSGFQVKLACNHLSKTCAEAFPAIFDSEFSFAEPTSFWIRKVV